MLKENTKTSTNTTKTIKKQMNFYLRRKFCLPGSFFSFLSPAAFKYRFTAECRFDVFVCRLGLPSNHICNNTKLKLSVKTISLTRTT